MNFWSEKISQNRRCKCLININPLCLYAMESKKMNNKLSTLVSSLMVSGLLIGSGFVYAEDMSVKMGSDDINVSVGGIKVEIDGSDSSVQVKTEGNDVDVTEGGVAVAGKSYANVDLKGMDFSNKDLTGADFSNADLTQVSFGGANLSGTNFKSVTFHDCDLRGAIVDGANFSNADFGTTKIYGVDFSKANMLNVDIGNANTEERASLSKSNDPVLSTAKSSANNKSVTEQASVKKSYKNVELNGVDFSNKNLSGVDFSNADLTNVNFQGANLSGANFSNISMDSCDLRGAIVDGVNFSNADFGSTKTAGVDFSRANMTSVDMSDVDIKTSASLSSNNIAIILTKEGEKHTPRVNLDIRFAHDSDRVESISMKQISDLSEALLSEALKDKGVIIEGHTDSDGTNAYNIDLSQRRSQSVIKILVDKHGIALSRLTSKGYGEEKPVYSNKTSFGKSVNRRVGVVLAGQ